MAWVAVDHDGTEYIYHEKPRREELFMQFHGGIFVELPHGGIEKLIGRTLTWADEPVELREVKQ